jgi:pimeloyl-ACP methyl ester carboxylesterase
MTAYALPEMADAYRAIIEGLSASMENRDATAFHHLEQIRARTLVIVGANDVRTSFEAHAAGVKRMPNATIVRIENCGHLPFLERPDEFSRLVQTFLRNRSETTSRDHDGRTQTPPM